MRSASADPLSSQSGSPRPMVMRSAQALRQNRPTASLVMTSEATNSSMQIVGRGCPLLVEQCLTYFDQAIDLGGGKPAATGKFQKA